MLPSNKKRLARAGGAILRNGYRKKQNNKPIALLKKLFTLSPHGLPAHLSGLLIFCYYLSVNQAQQRNKIR